MVFSIRLVPAGSVRTAVAIECLRLIEQIGSSLAEARFSAGHFPANMTAFFSRERVIGKSL